MPACGRRLSPSVRRQPSVPVTNPRRFHAPWRSHEQRPDSVAPWLRARRGRLRPAPGLRMLARIGFGRRRAGQRQRQADPGLQLRRPPQDLGRGRVPLGVQRPGHHHGAPAGGPVLRDALGHYQAHPPGRLPLRMVGRLPLAGELPQRHLPDRRQRQRRPVLLEDLRRPPDSGRGRHRPPDRLRLFPPGPVPALHRPARHPAVVPERLRRLLPQRVQRRLRLEGHPGLRGGPLQRQRRRHPGQQH